MPDRPSSRFWRLCLNPGWEKCDCLIVIESWHNQIALNMKPSQFSFFNAIKLGNLRSPIGKERVQDTSPPFHEPSVIKNMLSAIFNASRKEILVLCSRKKGNNKLYAWSMSPFNEIRNKFPSEYLERRYRAFG